ncbi:MAG TPA: Ig-like domain-containing protein [Gemmatimonadaceae bacterium]|nr:Ig-like domain-containing protein [Gemmatimonadaceae bacterium]
MLTAVAVFQLSCGDSSGPGNGPSAMAANSSTELTGAPGSDVFELPSVVVRNQSGQPVAGARVVFSVESGGGSVIGGNVTTDAAGVATVGGWTLGPNLGTNTMVARTGNLPPVTFTAVGSDPCGFAPVHVLGTTSNGQLTLHDCALSDGTFADFYTVNIPTAGTYVFTQAAAHFDTFLALLNATGGVLGLNDDVGTDTTHSSIKAILPAGNFILAANSYWPGATGAYTIASVASSAHVTGCEDAFVVRGITTAQSLQTTDCALNGIFGDEYVIVLDANQPVTVSMSSTNVDSYLEIHAASDLTLLASNDDADGTTKNASLVFTPTARDFYVITARTNTAGATGNYSLVIQ